MLGEGTANKTCERCGNLLIGKHERWCSLRCSRLGLKALYKKRNKDKIQAYARERRKREIQGGPSSNKILRGFLQRNPVCARCNSSKLVHLCHIKPRDKGGKHRDNLITLCPTHHHEFDILLRGFWRGQEH